MPKAIRKILLFTKTRLKKLMLVGVFYLFKIFVSFRQKNYIGVSVNMVCHSNRRITCDINTNQAVRDSRVHRWTAPCRNPPPTVLFSGRSSEVANGNPDQQSGAPNDRPTIAGDWWKVPLAILNWPTCVHVADWPPLVTAFSTFALST